MTNKPMRVFIGFDPREASAYAVARDSIRQFDRHIPIQGVVLSDLRVEGLYYRPTRLSLGRLWDDISEAYMSTEFAISRFLVPELVRRSSPQPFGWALFMDCDVLVRANLNELRELLTDDKALYCVKHKYAPAHDIKMDGQVQALYPRKNWSSVMAFHVDHHANDDLTPGLVNSVPGRQLHRFCWLKDEDIGELPKEWNHLVGVNNTNNDVKIAHFTEGGPWLHQFRDVEYADEWLARLERWAA